MAAAEDLLYLDYVNPHRKVRVEFEFLKGLHSETLRQSHEWCVMSGNRLYIRQSASKGVWGACVLLDPHKATLQRPAWQMAPILLDARLWGLFAERACWLHEHPQKVGNFIYDPEDKDLTQAPLRCCILGALFRGEQGRETYWSQLARCWDSLTQSGSEEWLRERALKPFLQALEDTEYDPAGAVRNLYAESSQLTLEERLGCVPKPEWLPRYLQDLTQRMHPPVAYRILSLMKPLLDSGAQPGQSQLYMEAHRWGNMLDAHSRMTSMQAALREHMPEMLKPLQPQPGAPVQPAAAAPQLSLFDPPVPPAASGVASRSRVRRR